MSGRRSSSADGTPTGTAGGASLIGATAMANVEAGLPTRMAMACSSDERAHGHVHRLRPRRLQHRLGLCHVGLRRDAAAEPVLGQLQRLLERLDRGIEQLPIAIDAAQREVVDRELSVQAEARRLEIGGARLRRRLAGGDGAVDASPDVGFVRDLDRQDEVVRGLMKGRAPDDCPMPGNASTEGATSTVGNRLARVPRTSARACANWASAAFRVWLETSICCSSALRSGSPNSSHQLPRSRSSAGCAVFQFGVFAEGRRDLDGRLHVLHRRRAGGERDHAPPARQA